MDIKKIKECRKILDKGWKKVVNMPNKFKTFRWHGVRFEVWRATGCQWNRIYFLIGGRKVYDLKRAELIGPSGDNFRKEYFKGRLVRTYDGWQNCFIEFCELLACLKHFPNDKEFELAGKSLELEDEVTRLYIKVYKNIFGKRRKQK